MIGRRSLLLAGVSLPAASAAFAQCVTDALTVDACLGGVRLTAPTTPPGATLNLNFMTPGALDPLITFTRASTATYFDATGTMQTAAINAPRWDYDPVSLQFRGLLLEDTRVNSLLNSAAPGTQSVTVTAAPWTLSFFGTGTITKSGAATGALVGTGPQRVQQTFTPTAGTLTLTLTGTVINAQIEAGVGATSFIATAGAPVTRASDVCLLPSANMGFFTGSPGGSWFAEFDYVNSTGGRVINHGTASLNAAPMQLNGSGSVGQYDAVANVFSATTTSTNAIVKGATTWTAGAAKACGNAGPVATAANLTNGYAVLSTVGVKFLSVGGTAAASGHIRRVAYWPRVLTDAEMQQVTT